MRRKQYKNRAEADKAHSLKMMGENNPNFGKGLPGEKNGMWGRHHSEKTKLEFRLKRLGKKASKETRAKMSLSRSGEKNHNWQGGQTYTESYRLIYKPSHPHARKSGYVLEHRLVMEQVLRRSLLPCEVVHHINRDPKDNRTENLVLFNSHAKHMKHHLKEDGKVALRRR